MMTKRQWDWACRATLARRVVFGGVAAVLCVGSAEAASSERPERTGVKSDASLRVHLSSSESGLKITAFEQREFSELEGLYGWLAAKKSVGDLPVVIQCDPGVKMNEVAVIVEQLSDLGFPTVELAVSNDHEEYLRRANKTLGSDEIIHSGKWMREYYVSEFGDEAAMVMWRDADRAVRENKMYLAMNLISQIPKRKNAKGDDTFLAEGSGEQKLSEDSVKQWLAWVLAHETRGVSRHVLVDCLGAMEERRAVRFLLDLISNKGLEFELKYKAVRALNRIRLREETLSGKIGGFLIVYDETEENLALLRKDRDRLEAWYREVADEYPAQLLSYLRSR